MTKYYAVERSSDHLQHYGVKGMRWGVRKAVGDYLKQRKTNKMRKRIDRFSENGNPGPDRKYRHDGYMHAVRNAPNSNRNKLFNKMMNEYEGQMGKRKDNYAGSPSSEKVWRKLNNQHRNDYLKAVLSDAKVPVNKHTMNMAHQIISAKDSEYSRYLPKKKR